MRCFFRRLPSLSGISRRILAGCLSVWAVQIVSYVVLSGTYRNTYTIDLRLSACLAAYPLLMLMCLTLGIVGALLIDLYIKFDPDR